MRIWIRDNWLLYLLAAIATVFFVAAAPNAQAQDKIVQEEDSISYKKKTSIDFSDVTIKGELSKPEGAYVGVRKDIKFKNY